MVRLPREVQHARPCHQMTRTTMGHREGIAGLHSGSWVVAWSSHVHTGLRRQGRRVGGHGATGRGIVDTREELRRLGHRRRLLRVHKGLVLRSDLNYGDLRGWRRTDSPCSRMTQCAFNGFDNISLHFLERLASRHTTVEIRQPMRRSCSGSAQLQRRIRSSLPPIQTAWPHDATNEFRRGDPRRVRRAPSLCPTSSQCRNCRWLPRWRTCTQPPAWRTRIISRTFTPHNGCELLRIDVGTKLLRRVIGRYRTAFDFYLHGQ